ncbi:hypothetical protein [Helicobacter macacae]|uniref:Uncharacterized protein n=1 Tax=Helicobacter macacae MIT 99-5501 TaxID=1357400 RepID=V8C8M1_9HELI|nr:hypothetical protein [Helicobacter macacae]ETD23360.1 hypothetical protein HMPREF2086_01162 [Helicobacter macacae MIT 99-5501]
MRKILLSIGVFLATLIVSANLLLFTSFGNKILAPILQAGLNYKLPIRTKIQSLRISFGKIEASLIIADTLKSNLKGRYTLKGFDILADFAPTDELRDILSASQKHSNQKSSPNSTKNAPQNNLQNTLQNLQNPPSNTSQNPTQSQAQNPAQNTSPYLFTLRFVGRYKDYIITSIKESSQISALEYLPTPSHATPNPLTTYSLSTHTFATHANVQSTQKRLAQIEQQTLPQTSKTQYSQVQNLQDEDDFGSFENTMEHFRHQNSQTPLPSLNTLPSLPDLSHPNTQLDNTDSTSLDFALDSPDLTLQNPLLDSSPDSILLDSALDFALDMMQNPANQTPQVNILARARFFEIKQYALELKAFPSIIVSKILDFPYDFYGIFDLKAKATLHAKREKSNINAILNAKNLIIQKNQKNQKIQRNPNANLLSLQARFGTQEGNLLSTLSISLKSSLTSQLKSLKSTPRKSIIDKPSTPKDILPNITLLAQASTNLKTLKTQAKITDTYEIPLGRLDFSQNGEYDLEIFNLANLGAMLSLRLQGDMHLQGNYDIQNSVIDGKSNTLGGVSYFELNGDNLKINAENIALEKLLALFGVPSVLEGRAQMSANYNFLFAKGTMSLQASNLGTNINSADLSFYGIEGLSKNPSPLGADLENILESNRLDFGDLQTTPKNVINTPQNTTTLSMQSKLNAGVNDCSLNIDTPSEKIESTRCTINLIAQNLQITLTLKPKKYTQQESQNQAQNPPEWTESKELESNMISPQNQQNLNSQNLIPQNYSNTQNPNIQSANIQNANIQNANIVEGLQINISGSFSSPQVQKNLPELPPDDDEFLEF